MSVNSSVTVALGGLVIPASELIASPVAGLAVLGASRRSTRPVQASEAPKLGAYGP
jgi:hypothetical protein